jgi:hypothetical protein
MSLQKRVKFKNISEIYNYNDNNHYEIETKDYDGPNKYRSFIEQFIISYIINCDIKNLMKKYIEIIQSMRFIIISNIRNILNNLLYKGNHTFYMMNYKIEKSDFLIKKMYSLYNLLSQSDFNIYLYG